MSASIRQRYPPAIVARFRELQTGQAALSVITYGELLYGIEKSPVRVRALRELEEIVSLIQVLPLPVGAAHIYGESRRVLEAKGEMIGNNDLWIAAHAKAQALILVTNNEREFRRIPALKIENWIK